jgi:hypothetical protein
MFLVDVIAHSIHSGFSYYIALPIWLLDGQQYKTCTRHCFFDLLDPNPSVSQVRDLPHRAIPKRAFKSLEAAYRATKSDAP